MIDLCSIAKIKKISRSLGKIILLNKKRHSEPQPRSFKVKAPS